MTKSTSRLGNELKGKSNLKRKLEEAFEMAEPQAARGRGTSVNSAEAQLSHITQLVGALVSGTRALVHQGPSSADKVALRKTAHQLAELCKQDDLVDVVVTAGAIEAVVPLLSLPVDKNDQSSNEELEKEACFILGLLAVKPEYQKSIADNQALPGLVRLLKEHRMTSITKSHPGSGGAARRAADAITNLAHENVDIKNMVREQGGIPPLVSLLEALDLKVQRAAAGALRTLAFKNEENKKQIVECDALPVLIQMLRSEDTGIHYEAVGVIGNLVHSSQAIKRQVLEEGALQPVINLLASDCHESQREAALLLGQFATTDADTKAKIVQRGAVPLLVSMLSHMDVSLREMAAFALGRLAQNSDNQAGIVQAGGLVPLLELLESKQYNLQHNAAFALYGIADNEDNITDIIREGAIQRLEECGKKLEVQASKDCVSKTISRIQIKLETNPRVLEHVVFMLRSNSKTQQQRAAMALAKMAPDAKIKAIFVDKRGLDVLLEMLVDPALSTAMLQDAASSMIKLDKKVSNHSPVDCLPAQPAKTVYLGAQYVNNSTLSDITFIVEDRKFYAHRIALLASSEAFRAMFNSGYREKDAPEIPIPNIPWAVFEAMMTYIYTGQVEVPSDLASELLQASDQYLLEGLKRICENKIAEGLSVDNLSTTFDLSEAFSAPQLAKSCVLFALENYVNVVESMDKHDYYMLMERMLPHLKSSLVENMTRPVSEGGRTGGAQSQGGANAAAVA